jgi:hypothetical protein
MPLPFSQSVSEVPGITLETTVNGKLEDVCSIGEANGQIVAFAKQQGTSTLPQASLVAKYTPSNSAALAAPLSQIIQKGKKKELIKAVSLFIPNISDILIIQSGNTPDVIFQTTDDKTFPIYLAGDGALMVLQIVASMINGSGGVLFLDEIDASIHYSVLEDIWKTISTLSSVFNCQVFAATHSRECVDAAFRAVSELDHTEDLAYIRLERGKETVRSVEYGPKNIKSALENEWEMR